jgi:tripartite-type tricarboxylate transporter receptor subunit TctC
MTHVPYKGFGQGVTDVLAGQVPMIFGGATASIGLIRSGKLRGLGVTSKTRVKMLTKCRPSPRRCPVSRSWPGTDFCADRHRQR